MSAADSIERTLRTVVELLVRKDYSALERLTHGVRLRASEMEKAVNDYGRTLALPPSDTFSLADVIPIRGTSPQAYSVRFRLCTQEEGQSGLEMQATFIDASKGEMMEVEIDNIIVA